MPITAVKSIVMTVTNLERSIDFYTTVLSFIKIADKHQIIGGEVTDESSLRESDFFRGR
jgi:catechol 2,3-dioxygenase-like lactoylglutathione lyase family enzyme